MTKPFLYIEKNHTYSLSKESEISFFCISDSKTNKNWIIQYNTTLDQIIHYAMGYSEAKDYDHNIYFAHNVDLSSRPELELFKMTESEFQQKRKEV